MAEPAENFDVVVKAHLNVLESNINALEKEIKKGVNDISTQKIKEIKKIIYTHLNDLVGIELAENEKAKLNMLEAKLEKLNNLYEELIKDYPI